MLDEKFQQKASKCRHRPGHSLEDEKIKVVRNEMKNGKATLRFHIHILNMTNFEAFRRNFS